MIQETVTTSADTTVFTFTFDLISAAYLTVALDGSPTTAWSLTGPHEVTMDAVVPPDTEVSFTRSTPISEPLVTFTQPSSIRAQEINLAVEQLLHNLQEQDFATGSVTGLSKYAGGTAWDGQGLPLKDIGDPTDDSDAATRGWVNGQVVASGQLPPVGPGDADKHLAVNAAGTGYALVSADSGQAGEMFLGLKPATSTQINQRDGRLSSPRTINFISTRADVIDLTNSFIVELLPPRTVKAFVGSAPTWDPVNFQLTLPAGSKYRLSFKGTAHNLLVSGQTFNTNSACLQINNGSTSQALAAQTVHGGKGDNNQSTGSVFSGTFDLETVVDTTQTGAILVDMRFAHYSQGDLFALDVPAGLKVEEVL